MNSNQLICILEWNRVLSKDWIENPEHPRLTGRIEIYLIIKFNSYLAGIFWILLQYNLSDRVKFKARFFTFSATSGLLSAAQWMTPSIPIINYCQTIVHRDKIIQFGLNSEKVSLTCSLFLIIGTDTRECEASKGDCNCTSEGINCLH